MTMTVALGTSTPTSMTVVETRIWSSLARNRCMTPSFSSLDMRPWSRPSFRPGNTCFDNGINDVGLMPGGDFALEEVPDARKMRLGGKAREDGSTAGGKLIEDGDVQVAVKGERECARNGCGGEDQDVGSVAARGSFIHKALALKNAEAVLLVDDGKAEAGKFDVVFDECVRADGKLRFAGANAFESGSLFGGLHAADEELDAIAGAFEDAASAEKVLDGENFGGGHESGLRGVLDGDDSGL